MRHSQLLAALLIAALALALAPHASAQGALQPLEGPLHLFNGEDLHGWVPYQSTPDADPAATWEIKEDGVLRCSGRPDGYLRTKLVYANYRLSLQWRWPAGGGDGGVMVHVQDEDSIWPQGIEASVANGHAGDVWALRTAFEERGESEVAHIAKQEASSEHPAGTWNTLEIECTPESVKVFVNGVLQNRATRTTVDRGHIALQSVGTPIEFRNIVLHPLAAPARQDASTSGEGNGRNS
jgi:hypothetical protein